MASPRAKPMCGDTRCMELWTKLSFNSSTETFVPIFSDWVYDTSVPYLQISPYLQIYISDRDMLKQV
jgi:hypothetical protein